MADSIKPVMNELSRVMMLKIYGAAHSRAFRVIWLANEIGLSYEHIPVTFPGEKPECKEPWYLALNPNGRVPTIDDNGFVMWESAAINLYLAEKYTNGWTALLRGDMPA